MKVEIEFTVPFPYEDLDLADEINRSGTVRDSWPIYGVELRIDGLRI